MTKKLYATVIALSITFCVLYYCAKPREYSLQELYREKSNSVLEVFSNYGESRIYERGAGFFISETGMFVTAAHVIIENNTNIFATQVTITSNRKVFYTARIKKVDLEHDIAILETTEQILPNRTKALPIFSYLTLNRDDLIAGDRVTTIGNPSPFLQIISEGIVASSNGQEIAPDSGKLKYKDLIVTTLIVYPGNSGGPVFNIRGQVVGVLTAGDEKQKLAMFQKTKYINRLLTNTSDKVIAYEKE